MVRHIRRVRVRTIAFYVVIAGLLCGGFFFLWAASLEIPDLSTVESRKISQSTKFYDRTGQVLLYDLHQDAQRTVVPISQISQNVQNATVALEDTNFYTHGGIRLTSIARAILANVLITLHISSGYTQGGSTLTQQVIKRALLTPEKDIGRKFKEWILAIKLEREMPKDKILELYLNEAPYGGSIYGVEEAANAYFGKKAADLTIAEAAYLAAMLQAPTYYSPYGNHRDALDARKNLALSRMLSAGFIQQSDFDAAKREIVTFKGQREKNIEAPHFVFYVRELLAEKYGEQALEENGMRVITTLDVDLERQAEEVVKRNALANVEKYNASNAAIVAIDPKTGQILAMAGSRDYFDTQIDGNFNIALAKRQPGSSFKPFVYAQAFSEGYTPDTVVFDVRTQFSTTCEPDNMTSENGCYSPENYDHIFRGPVSLRNALAQSINVPAVKVLYLVGIRDALRLAKSMGVTTLADPDRYGLTLVLGGGEVRLLDMTSAYGVFATNGVRYEPSAILRIEDAQGTVLEDNTSPRGSQILTPSVAMQINDVLSDNKARTPAFGEDSYLYFPGRDVAAKTGTTNDYRDAWIIGYTPSLVVGAWAGNNDNSPMEKKVAGFIVAPLWHEFMQQALQKFPTDSFSRIDSSQDELKPILRGVWQGGTTSVIDTRTGAPATDATPVEFRKELVTQGVHSILYWVDKSDPLGPPPVHPEADPQFRLWEPPVRAWAEEHGYVDDASVIVSSGNPGAPLPAATIVPSPTPTTPASTSNGFRIAQPTSGSTLPRTKPLFVTVSIPRGTNVVRADYYVNGKFIGSATKEPFSFGFVPSTIPGLTTQGRIQVVFSEETGGGGTAEVTVGFSD